MPKLSILFASIRPDYANVAMMNLLMSLRDGVTDFEIVAVAPFPLEAPEIKYIPEERPLGSSPAYRLAFEASTGDVITFFSDDMIATPGWARNLCEEVLEREKSVFPYVGGLRAINSNMFSTVYDLYFANWPVLSRATTGVVGIPFPGDEFIHHFSDGDLALRAWTKGGRVEMLPHRRMFVLMENEHRRPPVSRLTNIEPAFRILQGKWGPVMGSPPHASFPEVLRARDISELQPGNTYIGTTYPSDHPYRHPKPRA